MNKKSLLGLTLFTCLVTGILFLSADYLIKEEGQANTKKVQLYTKDNDSVNNKPIVEPTIEASLKDLNKVSKQGMENTEDSTSGTDETNGKDKTSEAASATVHHMNIVEPWLTTNPSDYGTNTMEQIGNGIAGDAGASSIDNSTDTSGASEVEKSNSEDATTDTLATSLTTYESPQLIYDSTAVDYKAFIPEMVIDSDLEAALDISNPSLTLGAEAAILFDADTKEVLFYKNPVQAMFPASTAKLLTSLVALDWCTQEEQVTVGDEIKMIASDSTRAFLMKGQILTLRNLLEGMLLPSGNDAAYAVAAYVGRKSLDDIKASKEEAVAEFVRLMNEKADSLGVKNSCFKTPDGYDAIGQYTTAYDMGLIGVAAANNDTIIDVTQRSSGRNIFISGEDVTWDNTNKLVTRYSGKYYSKAIGLKTGTSSLAGRCIIAAARNDNKKVVCVIMASTLEGRWEDAISLLKYGLD